MAEYRQKILAAIAANTAPDFFLSDGPWLPEYASRGIINAASPEVEEDINANFTDGGRSYVTFNGTVYGYPYETSTHQMYINNAMFEEAGLDPLNPPVNSWSDFREAANVLARSENGNLVQAGFLANPRLVYLADFLWNNDATIINEDQYGNLQEPVESRLMEPPAMETWQLWYDLYNTDKVASAVLPSHTDSFTQGLTAMIVSGNFFIDGLKINVPDMEYTIAPIPTNIGQNESSLGGWMWAVMESADAQNKEIAWDFIRWANTKENLMKTLEYYTWLVTRKDVLEDPALDALIPEKLKPFYAILPSITYVRPKTVIYQQLESGIDPIIQQMLLGDLTVEQAAQQAEDVTTKLLEESGGK